MYEKITIAVLLSAYIFTSTSILAASSPAPSSAKLPESLTEGPSHTMVAGEIAVTVSPYILPKTPAPRLKQIVHRFSEPVTIVIILGVIAVIVGVILSLASCIQLLTRKSPAEKPPPLEGTAEHLISVEVEHTEE